MNKKPYYWTCGIVMAVSFLFSFITRFQFNQRFPEEYEITLAMLLDVFAAQPLFYAGLGFLSALKLFGPMKKDRSRVTCLICGIALSLLFFGIAIASILMAPINNVVFMLLRQVFHAPGFFLVPGLLLGLGLNKEI